MPRPRNKEDLIIAATTNYEKLLNFIENRTENEKNIYYDFSSDEKKKEAHWKRDKNLRDVLMHLHEWHLLLLEWIKNRENGCIKPFLIFLRKKPFKNLRNLIERLWKHWIHFHRKNCLPTTIIRG